MKRYKSIIAEGLVLTGLLGFFGCGKQESNISLEYILKDKTVHTKVANVEEYLKKQGFKLVEKEYSFYTDTGKITYTNDGINFMMSMELGGSDNIDIDVSIKGDKGDFEFMKGLEKSLHEIMTKNSNSIKDFIKIIDVQYFPAKNKDEVPMIAIGMEGYDKECPKLIHFYVDDEYIFSWNTPKTFDASGKRIEEKELNPIKYGAACLPHEKGKSVTPESYNNLKQGKHTLKAVLEDYSGNTTEDTCAFRVE